jgi:hypothetical protein
MDKHVLLGLKIFPTTLRPMNAISTVIRNLENRALRWYGHVERMRGKDYLNVFHLSPPGRRRTG